MAILPNYYKVIRASQTSLQFHLKWWGKPILVIKAFRKYCTFKWYAFPIVVWMLFMVTVKWICEGE